MAEQHAHSAESHPCGRGVLSPDLRVRRPVRMGAALLAAMCLLVPALFAPLGAGAVDGTPSDAAIAWLDGEVASNGGTIAGFSPGSTDWGLTADVALARIATGRSNDAATAALADELLGALAEYTTWDTIGPEFTGVRVAGALAKTQLVATAAGRDTSSVSGVDLEAELRGLMRSDGEAAGRFSDRNPHGPDNSNGFDQAYAVLALSLSADGVPEPAVSFLVSQQCPGGGFRLVYNGTAGCDDDTETDPDATALAVQALLVVPRSAAVQQSLADALARLLGSQAADGSFAGSPPADVANANSTGLISQALRAAGQSDAADAGAAWIRKVQLDAAAAGTPAAPEVGAIGYQPQRRADALAGGIPVQSRDQWRRATSQGVLALDAGLFVTAGDDAPVEPSPVTSTTTTVPVVPGPVDPVPGDSVPGGTAAPSTTLASPTPPAPADGAPAAVAAEQAVAGNSRGAQLAATGTDGDTLGWTGLAMLVSGAAAVALSLRMRRAQREAWHWG